MMVGISSGNRLRSSLNRDCVLVARHEVARHEVDGEFVGETDAVLGRVRPVDVGGTGDPKLSFYGETFLLRSPLTEAL